MSKKKVLKLQVANVSEETSNNNAIITLKREDVIDLGFAKKTKKTQFLMAVDFKTAPKVKSEIELDISLFEVIVRESELEDEEGNMRKVRTNWLHFKET